jgi:hypothetical protein
MRLRLFGQIATDAARYRLGEKRHLHFDLLL